MIESELMELAEGMDLIYYDNAGDWFWNDDRNKMWAPHLNDKHCEQVLTWLSKNNWHYEERRQPTGHFGDAAGIWIEIWHHDSEVHHRWDGSLYFRHQGVCSLALRVVRETKEVK